MMAPDLVRDRRQLRSRHSLGSSQMNREALRFNFLRNALYHTARRRVLEGLSRFSNFLVLALGTASAADALGDWGISQGMLGLAMAIIAAFQFAFDWAGRARTHEFLQRRNYEVLADIESKPSLTTKQSAVFEGQISLLSAEEPPTYRALDTLAYNEALDATSGAALSGQRLVVPLWQVPLVHLFHFNGTNYRSIDEIEFARQAKRRRKQVMARLRRRRR